MYHILEWGEALTKTSPSPRIGADQEGGALVTRGHPQPGGEPMVPLSLAAKEGGSPSLYPLG